MTVFKVVSLCISVYIPFYLPLFVFACKGEVGMYSWRFYKKFLCCRRVIAEQAFDENPVIFPCGGKVCSLLKQREVRGQLLTVSSPSLWLLLEVTNVSEFTRFIFFISLYQSNPTVSSTAMPQNITIQNLLPILRASILPAFVRNTFPT